MERKTYKTSGTCSTLIRFSIDDEGLLHDVEFTGGCNGNLKAIGILTEGKPAEEIAGMLEGTTCGFKKTSCGDQLAKAIHASGY